MFEHLKAHLQGRVVLLGIGNTLHSDDAIGSLLAARLKDKVPFIVYDCAANPENYLGKAIRDQPDNIVIIDAADFKGEPGEIRVLEPGDIKPVNLFSTHNGSLELAINYLQSHSAADIIILAVQPKSIIFGDNLSPEVASTLDYLEQWFYEAAQQG
jgi:hydrogenase 3 maturation protease